MAKSMAELKERSIRQETSVFEVIKFCLKKVKDLKELEEGGYYPAMDVSIPRSLAPHEMVVDIFERLGTPSIWVCENCVSIGLTAKALYHYELAR